MTSTCERGQWGGGQCQGGRSRASNVTSNTRVLVPFVQGALTVSTMNEKLEEITKAVVANTMEINIPHKVWLSHYSCTSMQFFDGFPESYKECVYREEANRCTV